MAANAFSAVIHKGGVNQFIDVPARVSRAFTLFAEHSRVRVTGTINGHPLHATLVPTKDGTHRLYVNGGMRAATGVDVGDRVTLKLRPLRTDEVDVPEDLASALPRRRPGGASTCCRHRTAASSSDPLMTRVR